MFDGERRSHDGIMRWSAQEWSGMCWSWAQFRHKPHPYRLDRLIRPRQQPMPQRAWGYPTIKTLGSTITSVAAPSETILVTDLLPSPLPRQDLAGILASHRLDLLLRDSLRHQPADQPPEPIGTQTLAWRSMPSSWACCGPR